MNYFRQIHRISEQSYYAGWMRNIEFFLWKAVLEGAREFGVREITSAEIDHLKSLAEASGGWWHWSNEIEKPVFVPMSEWLTIYSNFSFKSSKYFGGVF